MLIVCFIMVYVCCLCLLLLKLLCHCFRRNTEDETTRGESGGWRCAFVGVPWRGSVSACLALGDTVSFDMFPKVLKWLSTLRHPGTPMRAHLKLPDQNFGWAWQETNLSTSSRRVRVTCVCVSLSLSLSLYIYIYIFIHIHTYMRCVYTYI